MIAVHPDMDFLEFILFEIYEFITVTKFGSFQLLCLIFFFCTTLFFCCYSNTNIKLLVLPHKSLWLYVHFFFLFHFLFFRSDYFHCRILKFPHIFQGKSHSSMKPSPLFLVQKLPLTSPLFLFLCQDLACSVHLKSVSLTSWVFAIMAVYSCHIIPIPVYLKINWYLLSFLLYQCNIFNMIYCDIYLLYTE